MTATGIDHFHPRHFSLLSDSALECFRVLLAKAIGMDHIPKSIDVLLVALLAKPESGDRPIGIFSSFLRVWGRWSRRKLGNAWEEANKRSYFYGGQGRGAEASAWSTGVLAEWADSQDQSCAFLFLDLQKAYENISHVHLIRSAIFFNFPLRILRFCLRGYRGTRIISVGGIMTPPVSTQSTIVAGCSWATSLLRLALILEFDSFKVAFDFIFLSVYIDDIIMGIIRNTMAAVGAALRQAESYLTAVFLR